MPLSGWEPARTGPLRQLELRACVAARGGAGGGPGGRPRVLGSSSRASASGSRAAAQSSDGADLCRRGSPAGEGPGAQKDTRLCVSRYPFLLGSAEVCGGCASTRFEEAAGRSAGPARGGLLFEDPASALSPGTRRRDLASSARALGSPNRGAGGGTPG